MLSNDLSRLVEQNVELYNFSLEQKEKFTLLWEKLNNTSNEKIQRKLHNPTILLKCCFFLTYINTARGSSNRNQMEKFLVDSQKVEINVDDFIKNLKLILPLFEGDDISNIASEIVKDFSYSTEIYRKFEESFNLFFDSHSTYFLSLKKMIWSLYTYIRIKVYGHSRNVLVCIPLLIAVFCFVFNDIDHSKFPKKLHVDPNEEGYKSKLNTSIMEILCNNLKYTMDSIKLIELKDMIIRDLSKLKEFGNLFKSGFSSFDLSTENEINDITKKLSCLYEDYIQFQFFDERIFLSSKNPSDSSPMKLTPFKRQKTYTNFDSTLGVQKPAAFKTLFFDKDNETCNSSNNSNVIKRPLPPSVHMESMTPCSRVIFMDKWIKDYISDWKKERLHERIATHDEDNEEYPLPIMRSLLESFRKLFETYRIRLETSMNDVKSLCEKMVYKLIQREETKFNKELANKLLKKDSFIKSALVLAVEFVLFIENVEEISFYKLAEVIELDLYDLWKIINPFLLFDLYIPKPIRLHFCEIEFQLLSFIIWKKPSEKFKKEVEQFFLESSTIAPNEISEEDIREVENIEFNNQSLFVFHDTETFYQEELFTPCITAENTGNSNYDHVNFRSYRYVKPVYIFLRRILNYCNLLNKKITEHLKLQKELMKESENLIKAILINKDYIDLLYDRHVDQIIICCILCVMKVRDVYKESDYKRIMNSYLLAKPDETQTTMNTLFTKIKVNGKAFVNLLEFYNKIFTHKLQKLINDLKDDEENPRVKKRKMSLPDEIICRNKLQTESAFDDKTITYEPIQKAMFNNRGYVAHSPIVRNYFLNSKEMGFSPLVSRTSYGSPNVNRTPRNRKMKDIYSDLIFFESAKLSNQSSLSKLSSSNTKMENPFLNKLNCLNPKSIKTSLNFESFAGPNQSPLLNELNRNSSYSFSGSQEMNEGVSPKFLSRTQSQTTPEFEKMKKY